MTRWFRAGLLGAAFMVVPQLVVAQARQGFVPGWERHGLDFSPNGVWRSRARSVSQTRASMLARGDMSSLNAPLRNGPAPAAAAVTGVLRVPVLMFGFQNSVVPQPFPVGDYSSALFATTPPTGRPYTLRTFYEQMSNGLFSIQGDVSNWVKLKNPEDTYTGLPGTCNGPCNGISTNAAVLSLQVGMAEAVDSVDGAVDFALYDNDGADGVPNSGDDDGFVDIVVFLHSELDGACQGANNNHPWAHRFSLQTLKNTNDPALGGGVIRIKDYLIQSGVGGVGGCTVASLVGPGTAAHELGHGLGLPDLYDTGNNTSTEGIGQWGLMGSGNYTTSFSPSRMEAWSLNEMGWVTLRALTTSGTYTLGAAPTSDTAFVITPTNSTRGEKFLIENRQPVQSDSAMIRVHCARSGNPAGCGGGVLIWHVDQTKLSQGGNALNVGAIHGLELIQADNTDNLRFAPVNRGDAGDPYPGISNNKFFSPASLPAAKLNASAHANGAVAGFAIDQIAINGGIASMRVAFGSTGTYRVNATKAAASILVDNVATTVFQNLFIDATPHTLSIVSPQVPGDGRRRYTFGSWSDGGAETHDVVATTAGDTITATVIQENKVSVTTIGHGTIGSTTSVLAPGNFVAENAPFTLTATPTGSDDFLGWTGDTTTTNATLVLPMGRPYDLTATFLSATDIVQHAITGASNLSSDQVSYLDQQGNNNGAFDVGDFLAWVRKTGATGALREYQAALRAAQTRTAKEK